MTMREISILVVLLFIFSGVLYAEEIVVPKNIESIMQKSSCEIKVSSPVMGQWCYINQPCPITWDTFNIKNYRTVYIHLVQVDLEHLSGWEGGEFLVANTGNYQWIVPENVGPLHNAFYAIRIKTPDKKCEGNSPGFGFKMKIEGIKRMQWKND